MICLTKTTRHTLDACGYDEIITIQELMGSLIVYFLSISIVKLLIPSQPPPSAFFTAVGVSGLLSWGLLAFRVFRGKEISWPLADQRGSRSAG